MAKGLTIEQIKAKWRDHTANSGPSWKAGVEAVKVSPTQLAARAASKMVAKIKEAVDSGRYQDACNAVGLPDWQDACVTKGLNRLMDGAAAGESAFGAYVDVGVPYTRKLAAEVRQMPNNTEAERNARLMAMVNGMRKLKYSRRKGR